MLLTINYSVIVIYYLLLLHLASSAVGAFIKEWHPIDTDWQNRLNWEGGRLPCPQSLVILPEEVVISVYVNGTAAWNTLVMPQTGELVLDDSFNLMDPTTPGSSCPPGEVHFKHWRPSSWFDPDQWQLSDPDGTVIRQPLAVPHSERVPCPHDSIHLSDRHSLSVDFDSVASITVGQIRYGEQMMTADELLNRLNGPEWRYQVHNPPRSVFVNGTECQDPLGCQCTTISDDVSKMQMVCSNAGTLCSNQLECSDGFRPPGHCCDNMCGAMIKLTVDDKIFTKSALDRLVLSMLEEDAIASGLMSYSYRTAVNILHLTVVDNTTNEKSIALAQKLYTYLMKDRGNGNLYGIVALEMSHSGISYPASHHLTPEELHLIASNLATVFGTLVLIGFAAVAYYVYRKKMRLLMGSREDLNVSFARFQNDRIEIGGIDDSFQEGMEHRRSSSSIVVDPSSGQSSSGNDGSGRPITTVVPSPYAEEPFLPDTLPSPAVAVLPSAWKKLRRSFVNPLFGDATVGHRMSGRWQMSTLMMTTSAATQENPVYDIDILPSDAAPSEQQQWNTTAVAVATAVTPLSVDEVITEDFPMAKLPHPVPDAPAGSPFEKDDDDVDEEAAEAINANDESIGNVLPQGEEEEVAQTDAFTVACTMSDDAPLVESEPIKLKAESSSSSAKPIGRNKNKPLKTLWKKATKKFSSSPSLPPSAPTITAAGGATLTSPAETSLSSTSSVQAESSVGSSEATAVVAEESTEHKPVIRSSSSSGQHQRDDEVQLTLAEETDE